MISREFWYRVSNVAQDLERALKEGDSSNYFTLLERSGKADEIRDAAKELVDQTLQAPSFHEEPFKIDSPSIPDITWREERRASDVLWLRRFKNEFVVAGRLKLILGVRVGDDISDEDDAGHIQPPANSKAWGEFFSRTVREEWRSLQPGVHLNLVKVVSREPLISSGVSEYEHGHDDFEIAPGEWYPRIWKVELNLQWQVRIAAKDMGLT